MSERQNPQVTDLSDDELDQVSGGATAAEVAAASMASQQAQQDAAATRNV